MAHASLKIVEPFGHAQATSDPAPAVVGQTPTTQPAPDHAPVLPPSTQLNALLAVHHAGSFSAAARALGVGQPAVSKRIKALESALGAQLVDRDTGALTREGAHAAEAIETHMSALALGLRTIRRPDTALTVALPPGAVGDAIRQIINTCQTDAAGSLRYVSGSSDAAVTFRPEPAGGGTESVYLFADEWAAVAGPGWAGALNLESRALASHPLVATSPVEHAAWALLLQDEHPENLTEVSNEDAQALIAEGRALGIANVALLTAIGTAPTIASRRRAWPGTSLWACLRDDTPAWDQGWALLNALQGAFSRAQ